MTIDTRALHDSRGRTLDTEWVEQAHRHSDVVISRQYQVKASRYTSLGFRDVTSGSHGVSRQRTSWMTFKASPSSQPTAPALESNLEATSCKTWLIQQRETKPYKA